MRPAHGHQLEAGKPTYRTSFWCWPTTTSKTMPPISATSPCAPTALNEQISWLLHDGYHVISVQDILDAHDEKTLPPSFCSALTTATAAFTPASGHCFGRGTSCLLTGGQLGGYAGK